MRLLSQLLWASAFLVAGSFSAAAVPITYTEEFTASGSLGGTAFSDADVTITLVGDTTNVFDDSGVFRNTTGSPTINISGVGTATFTDNAGVFLNATSAIAGFDGEDTNHLSHIIIIANTADAAFNGYDLTTAIGPIGPDGTICNCAFVVLFNTSDGGLSFSATSDVVFTATTAEGVPEPITLSLFGAGLAGAVALRRRWRKSA